MKIKLLIILMSSYLLYSQDVIYFDGSRAMEHIYYQCSFGPRFPGSEGHDVFADSLKIFLDNHSEMNLVYKDTIINPLTNKEVEITNFLTRYNPRASNRIMFIAHWDTRQFADRDSNFINDSSLTLLGANDGASGTAILMTIAEMLSKNPLTSIGVDLLFVDAEDNGLYGDSESWGLGTKSVAKHIKKPFPKYSICVDMVGDKNQEFYIEKYSYTYAPDVVRKVWNLANELGYNQFKYQIGTAIIDDHYVLYKETGIPSIDIIDFQYSENGKNYWHTTFDTPDKCSAESLESVGTVISTLIYREDRNEQ